MVSSVKGASLHGIGDNGRRTSSNEACKDALERAEGHSELCLTRALSAEQSGPGLFEEIVEGGVGDCDA